MLKKENGLTIVEVMIGMLLGLVILGTVYSLFTMQQKQFNVQEQITEMQQNARIAMVIMIREISMAGFNQPSAACTDSAAAVPRCTGTNTATNLPCAGITHAGADRISFTADLNSNCSIAAGTANPDENITYDLDGSGSTPVLSRTSNGNRQPVVEYVDALSFAYYDGSGNMTANLANIRKIRISITVRTAREDPNYTHPTSGDRYRRYRLESFAIPRNLGSFAGAAAPVAMKGDPAEFYRI